MTSGSIDCEQDSADARERNRQRRCGFRDADLRCVRGGREVFAGLDFEAAGGEALALVGHNGAGKTSLLRLIAGLLTPAAGTHRAGGRRAGHAGRRTGALSRPSRRAEALAQRHRESGVLARLPRRRADRSRRRDRGGRAGACADLPAAYLSAGQRRRLSIARLLVVRRPIWLLDEPTSALDVKGQALFAGLMTDHLAGGGLIVAATHSPLGIATRELRIGEAA